jgi:phosphoglycolate phosphatase
LQLSKKSSPFIIEIIDELSQECEPDVAEELAREGLRRLVELECEAARGKDVLPFTRQILGHLKGGGIKTGITTLTCIEAVNIIFPDRAAHIDVVVTPEQTKRIKPDPEQVEMALAQLGVVPEKALVVGDHPRDILAGKAFSVKTVAVLTGTVDRKALKEANPDYIVPDIRSLPDILRELSGK